jgi:hypothetical protein
MLLLCLFTVSFFLLNSVAPSEQLTTYTVCSWKNRATTIKGKAIRAGQTFTKVSDIKFASTGDWVIGIYGVGSSRKANKFTRVHIGFTFKTEITQERTAPDEKECFSN